MGTALPRAPSPTPAGAKGLTAPGGLSVPGGRGDRALRTRPQWGSVPTAPGTDTHWGIPPSPPHTGLTGRRD